MYSTDNTLTTPTTHWKYTDDTLTWHRHQPKLKHCRLVFREAFLLMIRRLLYFIASMFMTVHCYIGTSIFHKHLCKRRAYLLYIHCNDKRMRCHVNNASVVIRMNPKFLALSNYWGQGNVTQLASVKSRNLLNSSLKAYETGKTLKTFFC